MASKSAAKETHATALPAEAALLLLATYARHSRLTIPSGSVNEGDHTWACKADDAGTRLHLYREANVHHVSAARAELRDAEAELGARHRERKALNDLPSLSDLQRERLGCLDACVEEDERRVVQAQETLGRLEADRLEIVVPLDLANLTLEAR